MKRIAILAETSLASGRQIVTGISRFLDERNDWSVFQHSGPLGAMDPAAISQWQGDGIIARIANPELLALIQTKDPSFIERTTEMSVRLPATGRDMYIVQIQLDALGVQVGDTGIADRRQNAAQVRVAGKKRGFHQR